jgi:hypothetical protein
LWFFEVEFNNLGDKYLTVTYGDENLIQVWTTESGICELTVEVPEDTSARFLGTGEILYLVGRFDENMIEALVVNSRTGERISSTIRANGVVGGSVVWDYVAKDHAVIVTHETTDGTGCLERWNLHEDAFMWRRAGLKHFRGSPLSYERTVCPGGRFIVVYGGTGEVTVDILCCRSGDSLGSFLLPGCRSLPQLRFIPGNDHEVIFSWTEYVRGIKFLSVHNFLTNERTWEEAVDCGSVAVQHDGVTVLM